jgi:uncharacterized membrane protein YeaQ/YmgE (transglycosylase-associated protein family)
MDGPGVIIKAAADSGSKAHFSAGTEFASQRWPRTILGDKHRSYEMGILWTLIIGFVAGVIAKFLMPGDNEPSGFILTTVLGIVGAFVATYLGQALGWYGPAQGAGLIGAVVGAIIVLLVYGLIAGRRQRAI